MAIKCGYKTLGGTPKTCESDDHVVFASGVSQLTTLNPSRKGRPVMRSRAIAVELPDLC